MMTPRFILYTKLYQLDIAPTAERGTRLEVHRHQDEIKIAIRCSESDRQWLNGEELPA